MSNTIATLVQKVSPITPSHTVNDVGDALLADDYQALLSLPVIEDGRPVGVVSRYQLMGVFLHRFGREIHGRKPVLQFMNGSPLVVKASDAMEVAAAFISARISRPLTEDFIVVDDTGRYLGIGVVLDLLRAMEEQAVERNAALGKAYSELKASQTRLVQSEKMASLGQMVAGVAHEINTPLGYVRGNVEALEGVYGNAYDVIDRYDDLLTMLTGGEVDEQTFNINLAATAEASRQFRDSAAAGDIATVFKDSLFGIEQISELVQNLKNFSRLDQARTAKVNVHDCIDSAVAIAQHAIKGRAQVVKRYGTLPKVSCSPSQVNQVVLNMVVNAAQAMDHPGSIVLTTRGDDDAVLIEIADDGKGIPPEVLPRIFDPFFTTKPVGEGTGLGLAICFQIIEQHGGNIAVESKVGEGTRFTIRLPIGGAATLDLAPETTARAPVEDPVLPSAATHRDAAPLAANA